MKNILNDSRYVPMLLLVLGLAIAGMVTLRMQESAEHELQANFDALSGQLPDKIKRRIQTYEYGLRGARGAIIGAGGKSLTRERFRQYVASRNLPGEFPGASGFSFIQRIHPDEAPAFVAGVRREGLADFAIRQSRAHAGDLFVLKYTEPEANGYRAMGMDMAADDERRNTLLAAMRNDEALLTKPLSLLRASDKSALGLVMYLPVYRADVPQTDKTREQASIGWVSVPFFIEEALQGLDLNDNEIAFQLKDASSPDQARVFYTSEEFEQDTAQALRASISLPLYGRMWQLEVKALPTFFARQKLQDGHLIGGAIVALFALLAGLLYFNLRNKEARLSTEIFNAMPEGILVADTGGRIVRTNSRLEAIFGYGSGELIGQAVEILVPEAQRSMHIIKREAHSSMQRIPGAGRDLYGCRKDGSLFPVEITLGSLQIGGEQHVIATVTDITLRKETSEDRELYRTMIEHSSDAFFMIDDEKDSFEYINEATVKHFGATREEIMGWRIPDWDATVSEELLQELKLRPKNPHNVTFESLHRCKGGELVPVEVSLSRLTYRGHGVHFGYFKNISGRKKAEEALLLAIKQSEEARDQAEYANKAKSEFLSNMSHELRTPMNAILGFGQVLEFDETLGSEQQENVHEILKAGYHLLELINEVLDLAKVESGHIDLSLEPVEVYGVVQECLALVNMLADKRNIRIEYEGLQDAVVRADRIRLKQALLNLLSNAIKYNRHGGAVRIDAKPGEAENLRLQVSDTGPGIHPDRQKELFLPFNRLDAENSGIEGTGIGLSFTRRIVEMMGGSVGMVSEPGAGSTFWIELPLEDLHEYMEEQQGDSATPDGTSLHGAVEGKHIVLYVEDNPANLKLVAHILGRRKHIHLITAHTPELGIELALARKPELILLDINMPGMDGYRVLEILRAEEMMQGIPVVAITANAMTRDIERGIAAGFSAYMTKPLNVAEFNVMLDRLLGTDRTVKK